MAENNMIWPTIAPSAITCGPRDAGRMLEGQPFHSRCQTLAKASMAASQVASYPWSISGRCDDRRRYSKSTASPAALRLEKHDVTHHVAGVV